MSLISCLDNIVDIVGNCSNTRQSGVMYLDDIGVSLQDVTDGNDIDENASSLVNNKIGFCQQIIKNHVETHFNGKLERNTVLSNGVAGYYQENRVEESHTADTLGGLFLEVNKYPYLEIYIDKVRIFTKDAETFDLKIFDVMTGAELFTQSVTTNAGTITDVDVDQTFKTDGQKTQLFIAYPQQNVTTYRSQISQRGCSSCIFGSTYDGFMHRQGATIGSSETLSKSNLNLGGQTQGVSIIYSLNCSLDNFVCSIKNRLQYSLLYLVGAKLAEEILFSKNQNSTTIIFRGDAREMMERFESEYNMAMFGAFDDNGRKIKKGLLDQIALPNDICFKCKKTVKRKVMIP